MGVSVALSWKRDRFTHVRLSRTFLETRMGFFSLATLSHFLDNAPGFLMGVSVALSWKRGRFTHGRLVRIVLETRNVYSWAPLSHFLALPKLTGLLELV